MSEQNPPEQEPTIEELKKRIEKLETDVRVYKGLVEWKRDIIKGYRAALKIASDVGRMKAELIESGQTFEPQYHIDEELTEEGYYLGCVSLNVNDFFYAACADDELIPEDLIPEVYRIWKAFPGEDATGAWASIRRGEPPQARKIERRGGIEKWNDLCNRVRAMMDSLKEEEK